MKRACFFALALILAACSDNPDPLGSKLFYFHFDRIEITDKAVISALTTEAVGGRKATLQVDLMRDSLWLMTAIDTSVKDAVIFVSDGSPPFRLSIHPRGKGEMGALVKLNRVSAIRLVGKVIDGEGLERREREFFSVRISDVVPNQSTDIAQGAIKVVFRMIE